MMAGSTQAESQQFFAALKEYDMSNLVVVIQFFWRIMVCKPLKLYNNMLNL